MRIPNFKTEEGSILYKNTVGRLISPRVADVLLEHIHAYLKEFPITTLLDLGCGPGTISLPLARRHPYLDVTAVDSSNSMIALAKIEATNQGIQNIVFKPMDAGHIALDAKHFELVVCNLAFPFFARPLESIQEVFEIVRPGGRVFFTVPGRHTWKEFFDVAFSTIGDNLKLAKPFFVKFSQAERLPEAMSNAGFLDIQEERCLLPFHFENGEAVLAFLTELFHLLDYAPSDMKLELASEIDGLHPEGFSMHYEAVFLSARRPVEHELDAPLTQPIDSH